MSAIVATPVGTITCIGINALKGKFKTTYMAINNIPLMNSDLVTGLSLMLVFYFCWLEVWLFYYISGAYHVQYSVCDLKRYASLRQTNVSTYEAAMDLGATPLSAFFKVVLPDLAPGITSGFLLAFTMSLDDFIITYFTRGAGINTLSTLIYSEVRKGIKQQ